MINHQISSVPIVDQDKKYLGVINKKDIVFILRENKYELLSEQC
jgi:CBS domain-containing protein